MGYRSSVRNKPLNVGDKLRRYEKMDVASHLVCDVTSDPTKRYTKLQHEDQLRLDLQLLPFNAPQLAAGFFTASCIRFPIIVFFSFLFATVSLPYQFSAKSSKCACGWAQAGQTEGASVPVCRYPQLRQRQTTG